MTVTVVQNQDPDILRVFLVRHGQTEHNVKKILQGHLDIDVNEKGTEQAKLVARAFAPISLDALVSSDLVRCKSTVLEIEGLQSQRTEVKYSENLRERHMGHIQGMFLKDVVMKYGENFDIGEGKVNFRKRVLQEWQTIVKVYSNDSNVLLCTHGGFLRMLTKVLYEEFEYKLGNGMTQSDLKTPFNTSVTVIDINRIDPLQNIIQMFGNTDHLGGHFEVQDQLLR